MLLFLQKPGHAYLVILLNQQIIPQRQTIKHMTCITSHASAGQEREGKKLAMNQPNKDYTRS